MKVGSGGLPGGVRCVHGDPPGAAVPLTGWGTFTEALPECGYHVQMSLVPPSSHSPSFQTPTRHWHLHPLGHQALAQLGPLPPGNRAEGKGGKVADSAQRPLFFSFACLPFLPPSGQLSLCIPGQGPLYRTGGGWSQNSLVPTAHFTDRKRRRDPQYLCDGLLPDHSGSRVPGDRDIQA